MYSTKDDKALDEIEDETRDGDQPEDERYTSLSPENSKLITMGELLAMEFSENEWVVEKLIPHQGITIIAGPPGNFKTWLLLSMGISITKGEKFLGKFSCTQSKILIIDEEDHLRYLKERSVMLGANSVSPVYFLSQQGFLTNSEKWIKKVLDICEKEEIGVIFLDSLVRIHEGDENSSSEMSKVFRQIKKFCQAGKTVVITHHERKEQTVRSSAQSMMRGSSDISAALDSQLSVRRDKNQKDTLIVEQPKLRCDKASDPFEVSFIEENGKMLFTFVGIHSNEDEKQVRIREAIISSLTVNEGRLPMKEIVDQIIADEKAGEKLVRKILNGLIKTKKIISENGKRNEKICSLPGISDYQM